MPMRHQFVDTSAAATTAGEVQSSNWNADHQGSVAASTSAIPEVLTRTFNVVSSNSTAVVDLTSYSVPARTLGINRMLRWTAIGTRKQGSTATVGTHRMDVLHGGSSRWADITVAEAVAAGTSQPWFAEVLVGAVNSSGTRFIVGQTGYSSQAGSATFGIGDLSRIGAGGFRMIGQYGSSATFTITTGAAEVFAVKFNWVNLNSSREFKMYYSVLELI